MILTIAVLLSGVSFAALGCGDEDSGPAGAVQRYLAAMANQDIEAMVDLTNTPSALAALEEQGVTKDELVYSADAEMIRSFGSLEFTDVTMETQQDGDEAVVTITGGSMTVGGGVTLDLAMAADVGFPAEYDLAMIDDQWYIVGIE